MKDFFVGFFAVTIALIVAVATFMWIGLLLAIQVIVNNFKWVLLCGTALLIASWYL